MGHGDTVQGATMRNKRVHFRVERAGRSFAACSPQISITNVSRIKLHDAPAAVTCEGCRRSAEFRLRLTGAVVSRSVQRRLDAQRASSPADVLSIATREHLDIKVQGDGGFGSIFILRGVSDAGRDWIEEHCQEGDFNAFGHGARLVEHRFIEDIVRGARGEGLRVG
jgi:hypothetical protein